MTAAPPVATQSPTPAPAQSPAKADAPHGGHGPFWSLALGSIGVVFGDIGTSPIYSFKLALAQASARDGVHADAIMGVVSLALLSIVALPYIALRARRGHGTEAFAVAVKR